MRCLIVDDSPKFVAAARALLEYDGMTIVGVASNGAEALRRYEELGPDVTLIDVNLGEESGFAVVELLHRAGSTKSLPVILISSQEEHEIADQIADSPALGFVHKRALTADVIRNLVTSSERVEKGEDG